MKTFDLLQKLTEVAGPSGLEDAVRETIAEEWRPLADELVVDRMGNLLAIKHGTAEEGDGDDAPRLLLAAHMDEIALMVKAICHYPEGEADEDRKSVV